MTAPKTHGGARPGSGRRKLGKVTVRLALRPETRAKLNAVAEREMLSKSEVADIVLRETLK